jgi:hypothetical protein
MAEHEPCIGATSDWYTPPEYFKALGAALRESGLGFCAVIVEPARVQLPLSSAVRVARAVPLAE